MTDQPPGFVETLLTDTAAIADRFSAALADAAMAAIIGATSARRRPLDRRALRAAIHRGVSGYLSQEINDWRQERSLPFTWRYDPQRRRLDVVGRELHADSLRSAINRGVIPSAVATIIYSTPGLTLLLRGPNLRRWIAAEKGIPG